MTWEKRGWGSLHGSQASGPGGTDQGKWTRLPQPTVSLSPRPIHPSFREGERAKLGWASQEERSGGERGKQGRKAGKEARAGACGANGFAKLGVH